jgi:hypothetical protein
MTWILTDKEFAAVRALPASGRYEYLVKHAADEGRIWSLRGDDGWVIGADGHGRELHPVWPHERYAAAAIEGEWDGTRPEPIDIHEWLDKWLPGMVSARRLVAIFPSDQADDAAIDPVEFANDLREELDKLE